MKEPKDKRTKLWKIWKADFDKTNSVGVGDIVETITKTTGIKKAVEWLADGKDCGCNKRKEILNSIRLRFPVVRCFTEDLYNKWGAFRKQNNPTLTREEIAMLRDVYLQLFARDIGKPSCCVEQYITEIDKVYDKYQ